MLQQQQHRAEIWQESAILAASQSWKRSSVSPSLPHFLAGTWRHRYH